MTIGEFIKICEPYCNGDIRLSNWEDDNTEVWISYKSQGVIRFLKDKKITVPHVMKIYNDYIAVYDKYGINLTSNWNNDKRIDINDKKTLVEKLQEMNKLAKEIELKKKLRKVEDMF